jgi:hypothetical protein
VGTCVYFYFSQNQFFLKLRHEKKPYWKITIDSPPSCPKLNISLTTVQTLAGRPDRKETIDRRRKSQSNDCRSGWGRVNHGAKDDSNSEHFFPTPNKLLTFFLSCPMTLQSATRKLKVKMRHSSRDMVTLTKFFFVHTILIRDH